MTADRVKRGLIVMTGAHTPETNTRKEYSSRMEMRRDRRILNEMGIKSHAWQTSKGWSLSWHCDHDYNTYSMGWNITQGHKYKTECQKCIHAFEFSDNEPQNNKSYEKKV